MWLKNINFNNVWMSAGARNFFGQGYWYSKFLDYSGTTFVSKTVTLEPIVGNLAIDEIGNVKDLKPKCIYVDFWNGYVVNAVGLSNPGLKAILAKNLWQTYPEPFIISVMEHQEYGVIWNEISKHSFKSPFGIEINLSCPNIDYHVYYEYIKWILDSYYLSAPLILNFSVDFNPEMVAELSKHPNCDAISVANTIRYGNHIDIDWSKITPLSEFGGGAVSGKPLLPILLNNLEWLNLYDVEKPIIAGGGILSVKDLKSVVNSSKYVKAVKLGTAGILRPWRLKEMIMVGNQILS